MPFLFVLVMVTAVSVLLYTLCAVLCVQVILGSIGEEIWSHYKNESFGISVLRALRLLRVFKVTRSAFILEFIKYPYSLRPKNLPGLSGRGFERSDCKISVKKKVSSYPYSDRFFLLKLSQRGEAQFPSIVNCITVELLNVSYIYPHFKFNRNILC